MTSHDVEEVAVARRLGVSREDVIAAAVRVCDRDGRDQLTVAAVAAEVGCRPPSVYHHVDGLDGLARAVTLVATRELIELLDHASVDTSGLAALQAMATAAQEWGTSHPARFDAVRRPVSVSADPELAAARTEVLLPVHDALADLGIQAADRPPLVAALVAAVRGCIAADLDADSGPDVTLADARAAGHQLLMGLLLDHIGAVQPAVAP